jgi:hypothetical protein
MPREVSYYYLCSKFNCLPDDGGLLSQDPHLMEAFILCMNIEGEYQEYDKKRQEQKQKVEEQRQKLGHKR